MCIENPLRDDIIQSTVGYLQLYTDKLQNSLKVGEIEFYPCHVTSSQFSEEWRKTNIVSAPTFTAIPSAVYSTKVLNFNVYIELHVEVAL